jgi:hypothetical protein
MNIIGLQASDLDVICSLSFAKEKIENHVRIGLMKR